MATLSARQLIAEAEDALEEAKESYVRRFGWTNSSNNPGSLWLWHRDFSDIDAARMEWWRSACASNPPLGNPSRPIPYGKMTVPLDIAVHITIAELDQELDQDGDPDTPEITPESFETGEFLMTEEDPE